jgi:hypothetical protein
MTVVVSADGSSADGSSASTRWRMSHRGVARRQQQYDAEPFRIEGPRSHAAPLHESDLVDPVVHARRWFTLATLCLSLLIIVMDNTILNVAIPSLVKELGATNSQLQWIVDGYTLVFAGLLLTTGSLGDRFGRKLALRVGIVIFASVGAVGAGRQPLEPHHDQSVDGIGGADHAVTLSILTNVFRDPGAARSPSGPASPASGWHSARSSAACCSLTSRGARCSG